jgi:hypothetical protein
MNAYVGNTIFLRQKNTEENRIRLRLTCEFKIAKENLVMLTKSFTKALLCSLILLAASMLAPLAAAGGFYLAVERPAKGDAEFKDAVLVVRPYGCHQPEDANVKVTAEGLVNGKRQSIVVSLARASKGVYAVKQQWPSTGVWVLNISGEYLGAVRSALVELGTQGKLSGGDDGKVASRLEQRKFTASEIDSALQSLSGKLARK